MIIGITGHAQHGKDTVAQRLVDAWGFQRVAFADTLKELLRRVNPRVGPFGRHLHHLLESGGWDAAKAYPDVRRLLQRLGTEARELLGADVWINAARRQMVPAANYVIPDVRFPNEAEFVMTSGGLLVRVTRPGFASAGVDLEHPSERFVDSLPVQYELINDGDIYDLWTKVDAMMLELQEAQDV